MTNNLHICSLKRRLYDVRQNNNNSSGGLNTIMSSQTSRGVISRIQRAIQQNDIVSVVRPIEHHTHTAIFINKFYNSGLLLV